MDKKIFTILFLVISLSFYSFAFAETILLKSGQKIEGKILERNDKQIRIEVKGLSVVCLLADIESIGAQEIPPSMENKENNATGKILGEAKPTEIIEKVINTYRSMETYKAKGTVSLDMDTGDKKITSSIEFSILLKKPNLYLISWTEKNTSAPDTIQSGTVWSDGTQPYLYMGITNTYAKIMNDELALGSATGISGGAAFTIPSIFLSVFNTQTPLINRLINAKVEKVEEVENEECYVISGSSKISEKETFWISKSKYLIIKYVRSLEPPAGGLKMPEFTEEQLEVSIKSMGQEVTEESKKRTREMINKSRDAFRNSNRKGYCSELHLQISSPGLSKADFQFVLPEGAILKESFFDLFHAGSK